MALDKLLKRGLIIGGLGFAGMATGLSGIVWATNNYHEHPDEARLEELQKALNQTVSISEMINIMENPQKKDMYIGMLQEYDEINARSGEAIREVEKRNVPYRNISTLSAFFYIFSGLVFAWGTRDIVDYRSKRKRPEYSTSNSTS